MTNAKPIGGKTGESMSQEVDFSKERKEVSTQYIKCDACGGNMNFDPTLQKLKCEHCGSVVDVQKNFDVKENDIEKGFENVEKWDPKEQVTYKCENCGAVVVVSAGEEATLCPFCGTSHVIRAEDLAGIKPQVVIPFQFGADKAEEYSRKWAKKRLFAPRKFKKTLESGNFRGVYEPCFTFDSKTFSRYVGRVGDRHTRTVGSGKNRRTETYVVYRNVSGQFNHFFDDVMVATNDNFGQALLNKLTPFKTSAACVFESKYLSGYYADRYRKDLKESWGDAKTFMDAELRRLIKQTLHCDVVDYLNVWTQHSDVTYKYVLLPVYMLQYRFHKKNYPVYINGSTGKVKGKTPVSPLRVAIASVLGVAVCVGLYVLYLWMNGAF